MEPVSPQAMQSQPLELQFSGRTPPQLEGNAARRASSAAPVSTVKFGQRMSIEADGTPNTARSVRTSMQEEMMQQNCEALHGTAKRLSRRVVQGRQSVRKSECWMDDTVDEDQKAAAARLAAKLMQRQ